MIYYKIIVMNYLDTTELPVVTTITMYNNYNDSYYKIVEDAYHSSSKAALVKFSLS